MENNVDIYDENNNYWGYVKENPSGIYDVYNKQNEWVGTADESESKNYREIHDDKGSVIGSVDAPLIGVTSFHPAGNEQTGNTNKYASKHINPFGIRLIVSNCCIVVYWIIALWCFYQVVKDYQVFFLILGMVNALLIGSTVYEIKRLRSKN